MTVVTAPEVVLTVVQLSFMVDEPVYSKSAQSRIGALLEVVIPRNLAVTENWLA